MDSIQWHKESMCPVGYLWPRANLGGSGRQLRVQYILLRRLCRHSPSATCSKCRSEDANLEAPRSDKSAGYCWSTSRRQRSSLSTEGLIWGVDGFLYICGYGTCCTFGMARSKEKFEWRDLQMGRVHDCSMSYVRGMCHVLNLFIEYLILH